MGWYYLGWLDKNGDLVVHYLCSGHPKPPEVVERTRTNIIDL
jgi:hypothetical protein